MLIAHGAYEDMRFNKGGNVYAEAGVTSGQGFFGTSTITCTQGILLRLCWWMSI